MLAKLKDTFLVILGIVVLLMLANINNIVAATTPRWFQCFWGLCGG